jgi:uncharacterized SAM-binding protein YcdF (DUF218 family)
MTASSLASLLAVLAVLAPATAAVGEWLVTSDALQPARAIVVLGGHPKARAPEAAATFRAGWAPEIWLTGGAGDDERRILAQQGVPAAAIRALGGPARSTADEMRSIDRALEQAGGGRVIFITSKFHTRRVRLLWNALARRPADAIVRASAADPYDPARWWQNERDVRAVMREYLGIVQALTVW